MVSLSRNSKKFCIGLVIVVSFGIMGDRVLFAQTQSASHPQGQADPSLQTRVDSQQAGKTSPSFLSRVMAPLWFLRRTWVQFQRHLDEVSEALQAKRKLEISNANLEVDLASCKLERREKTGKEMTHQYEKKLVEATGAPTGRTQGGIAYKPPTDLSSRQLQTLAVGYFNRRQYEQAAVIFSHLMQLSNSSSIENKKQKNTVDPKSFKTAQNLLMTGLSWYRLENYSQADFYFEEALKVPESNESRRYQAQARLWKALVAYKAGQKIKVQYWLQDFFDHHPHSMEAAWINRPKEIRSTEDRNEKPSHL